MEEAICCFFQAADNRIKLVGLAIKGIWNLPVATVVTVIEEELDLAVEILRRPSHHIAQIVAIHRDKIAAPMVIIVVDLPGDLLADVIARFGGGRDGTRVG